MRFLKTQAAKKRGKGLQCVKGFLADKGNFHNSGFGSLCLKARHGENRSGKSTEQLAEEEHEQ